MWGIFVSHRELVQIVVNSLQVADAFVAAFAVRNNAHGLLISPRRGAGLATSPRIMQKTIPSAERNFHLEALLKLTIRGTGDSFHCIAREGIFYMKRLGRGYRFFFLHALCGLAVVGLGGCGGLATLHPLPETLQVRKLSFPYEQGMPVAWHPEGRKLAIGGGGLQIVDLDSGASSQISQERPDAVAWGDDGKQLAASFHRENESLLRIFTAGGREIGNLSVAGRIHHLVWGHGQEMLAAVVRMEHFSIGNKIDYSLLRWSGAGEPLETQLHSVMVRRGTVAAWGDQLYRTFSLALSPLGEAILYTRLHEPPANRPHLRVMLRHLSTGNEEEIGRAELGSGTALFLADGDTMLYGDGILQTHWLDEQRQTVTRFRVAGNFLASTSSGRAIFIDGHLFQQNEESAIFPGANVGYFSPLGEEMLIGVGSNLYLLTGLAQDPALVFTPAARQKLLQLRQLRAEKLISPAEYAAAKQKIATP
jgi:hypothetical protein